MEWLFAGGILTAVMAFYGQAKSFCQQAYSRVVVTIEVTDLAAVAVLAYLRTDLTASRFGLRTYRGWLDFVRPAARKQAVAGEDLGKGTRIYWLGRVPLWVRRTSDSESNRDNTSFLYRPLSVSFFRGTIDPDQFIISAVRCLNSMNDCTSDNAVNRHKIEYVSGSDGKKQTGMRDFEGASPGGRLHKDRPDDIRSVRILEWAHDDIGPLVYSGSALERMFLSPEAGQMVTEIRTWLQSREWHRDRGLPWKRGFGLTGKPGTGKTTFVRAVGEDFDLPIFVFDLPTLYNDELRSHWQRIQFNTPCIVLFDDIDGVFQDRENPNSTLTFDCFLNCLDGVARSDGILTFITTNRPEMLSDALTRPGRIDRMVQMVSPDIEGRRKIAGRILADWPDDAAQAVADGFEDSGAEFERRCRELALERFWGEKATELEAVPA